MDQDELTLQEPEITEEPEEVTEPETDVDMDAETDIDTDTEEAAPAALPAEETTEPTDGEETPPQEEQRYPVAYGEDTRELTVEEMTAYAQRGMRYDEIAPVWDELSRLAAERRETPEQLVKGIAAAEERVLYDRLLREAKGDRSVADRLMRLAKSERQAARDNAEREKSVAAENARKTQTERLAAEFVELQGEFPQLREFKELPKAVVTMAVNKNMHLVDAYLRYRHAENRKIEQNTKSQQAAAMSAIGSLAATVPERDAVDPLIEAMMAGVRAAL